MSMFDSWDTIETSTSRIGCMMNKVTMRQYSKSFKNGERLYRRLMVSQNLIRESGAEAFTLKNKGGLYAMVPDENGPLRAIGSRMLGISSAVLDEMVEKIGEDECQASVIDGAIVFQINDNFIIG